MPMTSEIATTAAPKARRSRSKLRPGYRRLARGRRMACGAASQAHVAPNPRNLSAREPAPAPALRYLGGAVAARLDLSGRTAVRALSDGESGLL